MVDPQEIPQLARQLFDMSKEYLRQETVEPAKRLGKQAGLGLGGAALLGLGAFLMAWALYYGLVQGLPEGEWYVVLARLITAVVTALAAGLIVWRMQGDHQQS